MAALAVLVMPPDRAHRWHHEPLGSHPADLMSLTCRVQAGKHDALAVNHELAGVVFGVIKRVLRDPAMSEVVTREVFVEMWRTVAEPLNLPLGTVKSRVRLGSRKPQGNPRAAS